MSDPVLLAQHCPDSLLPSSAGTFLKLAHANGWDANASVAVGPPDDASLAVMSVCVWARRDNVKIYARWECPSDRSRPFSFSAAYRTPGVHGIPDALNFSEAKQALI